MSSYDDDSRDEFRQAMAEYGFDEVEPEDDLEDAVQELVDDLEALPEKMVLLIDHLLQGCDMADAAYYAGYGRGTEGLHKVLKKDTGQSAKEKLGGFKQIHIYGREKAQARMSIRLSADES